MTPEAIEKWKANARSDRETYKVLLDWALEKGLVKPAHSRDMLQARFEAWLSGESLWIIRYSITLGGYQFGSRIGILALSEAHAKQKFEEIESHLTRRIAFVSKDDWDPPITYTPIERRGWLE